MTAATANSHASDVAKHVLATIGQAKGGGRPGGGGGGGGHTKSNGIDYHGGPVMLGTTNVYYIWYGDWSGNSATTILTDLAKNIGGSPYFNINTTYYDGSNVHLSNSVNYGGSTTDNYSHGIYAQRCRRAADRRQGDRQWRAFRRTPTASISC